MNTAIYIGPYRQYDYNGTLSNIYLNSLSTSLKKNNIKIYSRPLFLDSTVIQNNISTNYTNTEIIDESISNCAAIIQHAPVEYIAIQKKWKNICIPIFDPKLTKASAYSSTQKLNDVDHIIVSSEYHKHFLLKSGISTPISICDEDIHSAVAPEALQQKYDFGPIGNDLYHFGFIGSYSKNIKIIQKTILAFVVAYRQHTNTQLIFFLRGTQTDKNEIDKFYSDNLKNLGVSSFNNVFFIFSPLDINASIASLNSIDCLLSINDDHIQDLYESYIIKQNKAVISRNHLDIINVPPSSLEYDIEDLIGSISTESLIHKMANITRTGTSSKNKKSHRPNKTIGETICHIL